MKPGHLIVYFFALTLTVWAVANKSMFTRHAIAEVHTVQTFEQTVEEWSTELSESIAAIQVLPDVEGNCLPVALELQKRIVDTGRIAFIAVVHPEELETGHALVVYSSEVAGRLDSVIDNGYSTYNKVQPKDFLDTGVFGTYTGTCQDPDVTNGTCGQIGLAW